MSKKTDKFRQVRLYPETLQKLNEARAKHPLNPSLIALVNAVLLIQWDGVIPAGYTVFPPQKAEGK